MKSKVNFMRARRQGFTLVEVLVVITIIVVLSKIDGSRTWAMTDVDQLHPDAINAAWLPNVPEGMAHGDYRLAIYFDGSSGKVNVKNQPK